MHPFTNFDGWMATRHAVPLGTVHYQGAAWHLDDPKAAMRLILALLEVKVITLIPNPNRQNPIQSLSSLHLQFAHPDDLWMNQNDDGTENIMQPHAFFLNLKQTAWVDGNN